MAVMGRRAYFKRALAREELGRSCIYLLIQSGGGDELPEVYVGESDDFAQRYAASPFPIPFDNFVVFTNKDDNLTRAHVKWLEREVWSLLVQNQGKVTVANRSTPTGSKLPEAETASMGTFLDNMIYVLEALGFEFFGMMTETAAEAINVPTSMQAASAETAALRPAVQSFYTSAAPRRKDARAYLDMTADGYILKAGSLISSNPTDSLPANVSKLRRQLVEELALVPHDDCFRLEKDIVFSSPSPASALVKGRSSTGHGDWMRLTDRRRLGDVLRDR